MDNALAISRKLRALSLHPFNGHQSSTHELFLPPLDINMPDGFPLDRILPHPIQAQLTTDITSPFDADNSNIVNFFSMLKKDNKSQQLVYYQAGIGTYTFPQIAKPFMAKWQKTIDMAIGNHLDATLWGYEFLMERYHAKDKICIFGFSRGAYTARALAGMIQKYGWFAPSGNYQQVPFAYEMYSRDDETGWEQSTRFKKTFSMDVGIEFVGVWDTVCSVGLIPRTLPFIQGNTAIRYFRHAISLDERRAKFKANYWHRASDSDQNRTKPGEISQTNRLHPNGGHDHDHKGHTEEESNEPQRVREVWFAGCHSDIGGGAVRDDTPHSLARISLRWMIHECFHLRPPSLAPTPAPTAQVSRAVESSDKTLVDLTEESEELEDARSPIHDQLKRAKTWWWWILEFLPMPHREQILRQGHYVWVHYWKYVFVTSIILGHSHGNDYRRINLGRGRTVPESVRDKEEEMLVHRSVKTRMDIKELKYKPKVNFEDFKYKLVDH
ncbi:hypothetical protein EI94DRAFT_1714137 [Lactarius quietus]|nr:hypothetical protein EI94DRAFT_1714137 [Lactarius quietus]